jgi:hypothetical protein
MPSEFAPSDLYITEQFYPYREPDNILPFLNQPTATFPPPGLSYAPASKTGAFHSTAQLPELFPSQPLPRPIGTGRPSSSVTYEDYDPAQIADGVSNRKYSRSLQPFDTYTNPFSESLANSQLHDFIEQPKTNSVASNTQFGDLWMQQRISTNCSWPHPGVPSPRAFRDTSDQPPLSIFSRPQTRRGNIPTHRDSQAEPHETRNKLGDTALPHGVFKKRRHSVPRKAAVAACAAIARAAEKDLESELEEFSLKSPKRTWAQVVSNPIKKEEPEKSIALHGPAQRASSPKEENADEGDCKTWAKVAAGARNETQETQQKMKTDSFGKHQMTGTFKQGRLFMNTKSKGEGTSGSLMRNSKAVSNDGPLVLRTKEHPPRGESQKRRVPYSQSPKVAKDVKH